MILLHLPVDISFPLSFCHLACNNFITGGPLINGHLYYYGEGGPGGYHGVGVIDTGMFKELPEFLAFRYAQTNLKVRLMCEVVSFAEKIFDLFAKLRLFCIWLRIRRWKPIAGLIMNVILGSALKAYGNKQNLILTRTNCP